MGDRPSDAEQPGAKREKRGASRQLTKDDGSDGEDDEPVQMGTFQKASEDVMAKRRVIKARRPAGGAPATAPSNPAANPFAGIKLAAPAASDVKPAAASEVPKKGGWDPAFLAKAQSAATKATEAAAAEIEEKSGGDKPATGGGGGTAKPAAPAAASKWPAAFLAKANEGSAAATAAAAADIKKAGGGGGDGAPAAPPAAPKPAGGGWPAGFLAKAKEGSDAAKEAVAKEIEKEKGGDAAPAAAPIFGGAGAGGFSFAATQANAFSFGGATSAATSGGLSFGSSTSPSSEGGGGGGGFKFGTGGSFASFGAAAGGGGDGASAFPTLKSVFGDGSGGGTVQLGGTAPQPAVKLSEVEAKTGEEEEEAVFATEGALYEFDQADDAGPGKWKERGKGKLSVNVGKDGKARMVMRARGNLRLLLNAKLWPEMQPSRMDGGKGVSFTVVNAAAPAGADGDKEGREGKEGKGEEDPMGTYALRLKGEGMMEAFIEVVDKYKK